MLNFKTYNKKLLQISNNSLDKNENSLYNFNDFDSEIKNYAIPINLENNFLVYTEDIKGRFVSIKEYINGILYDKIVSLPNFNSNLNSKSNSKSDSENITNQYILINTNILDEKMNKINKQSI